jgi:phage shock protein A
MALLERISTLLRANLNDLLDKAEDPSKMLKQLLLDMENQLLQVKTQVAIAIADQHLLEKNLAEHEAAVASWRRKAELALNRNDEALARSALDRSVQNEALLAGYTKQLEDQRLETQTLRDNYTRLLAKLVDTQAQGELLLTQQRRVRNGSQPLKTIAPSRVLERLKDSIATTEANKAAARALPEEVNSVEDRFRALEREERIDTLLEELRSKPRLLQS